MARLLKRLGFFVVRGSSSRGGAGGLKGLVDAVEQGKSACLAVDGPRGPVYQVKPGVVSLAQWTGCKIYPAGVWTSSKWRIPKAWNEGYYPKPFSRSVVFFGAPLEVPKEVSEKEKAALQEALRVSLLEARRAAETYANRKRFTFQEPQRNPAS